MNIENSIAYISDKKRTSLQNTLSKLPFHLDIIHYKNVEQITRELEKRFPDLLVIKLSKDLMSENELLLKGLKKIPNCIDTPIVFCFDHLSNKKTVDLLQAGAFDVYLGNEDIQFLEHKISKIFEIQKSKQVRNKLYHLLKEPYYLLDESTVLEAFIGDNHDVLKYDHVNILNLYKQKNSLTILSKNQLSKVQEKNILKRVLNAYSHVFHSKVEHKSFNIESYGFQANNSKTKKISLAALNYISLPVVVQDKLYAIVEIGKSHKFSSEEIGFFIAIINAANLIIQNNLLLRDAEEVNVRLSELDKQKNAFLRICSHELKNPMGIIKGYVEFLQDGISGELSENQKEIMERIHVNVDRLLRLTIDILDFPKFDGNKIEVKRSLCDLKQVINTVLDTFEYEAKKRKIELKFEFPAKLPFIYIDSDRIQQVFTNLIHNALKFTKEKGQVNVSLKLEDREADPQYDNILGQDYFQNIHITIKDTGTGIPKEVLPYMFTEKIIRTFDQNNKFSGHGLGLIISKEIVEKHNGKIWVKTKENVGSSFHFVLPVDDRAFEVNRAMNEVSQLIANSITTNEQFFLVIISIKDVNNIDDLDNFTSSINFFDHLPKMALDFKDRFIGFYRVDKDKILLISFQEKPKELKKDLDTFLKFLENFKIDYFRKIDKLKLGKAVACFPRNGKRAETLIKSALGKL
ncbi:MAG: ATP-binding protein [Pseudomonadota bacterium]